MHLHKNYICQTKEEFVVNVLAMGIATQLLAVRNGKTLEQWSEYISETAEKQYKQLTPTQIKQMVELYVKISQTGIEI